MNFSGGTPLYLGEQICEKGARFPIGPAPDLYALGVLFYLMITKENPTWYIKYSSYSDWSSKTRQNNNLLNHFDRTF